MLKKLFFIIILSLVCVSNVLATITFTDGKWETTFDCTATYQWENTLDCDGLYWLSREGFIRESLSDGVTNNWTQSSTTTEYYYTGSKLDAPHNLQTAIVTAGNGDAIYKNSVWQEQSLAGTLTEGEYAVGDNDSLGSDTLYIYSSTDPDSEADDYIYVFSVQNNADTGESDYITYINAAANNPLGAGNGYRNYNGDGQNIGTGAVQAEFSTAQTELYIRFYMKYENGYAWDSVNPEYDKIIYLWTDNSETDTQAILDFVGDEIAVIAQATSDSHQLETTGGKGWPNIMGKATSDGTWHCYEIYIKMDTNGTSSIVGDEDGEGRIWVDGSLLVEKLDMNWSNGDTTSKLGWVRFYFGSNQAKPANSVAKTVEFDDFVVYNTTPPNTDANGNSYIGPINADKARGKPGTNIKLIPGS